MSKNHNEYLRYTEYYIISGAYHIVNVVNEILTQSASYSVNIKEYLRNQVVSKQVALNETIRNNNNNNNNNGKIIHLNDNDVDEDGFVVIKMRRQKRHNGNNNRTTVAVTTDNDNEILTNVQEVIDQLINDIVIKNLD